jgi:hypothetical protein
MTNITRMFEGLNVRATKEELILGGENFTNQPQLVDGDYAVVPLVYHHIHCLDSIRKLHYIDHYRALNYDTTTTEGHFGKPYLLESFATYNTRLTTPDHCLETLRKQVMCHADLAMLSAEWVAPVAEKEHIVLRSNSESTCLRWDPIRSWAMERALDRGSYSIRAGPFG